MGLAFARPTFIATYLAAFFFFAVRVFLRPARFLVGLFTAFFVALVFLEATFLRGFAAFFFVAVLALAMTFFPFNC